MDIGVYVHIPFCISKCRYCDFNSITAPDGLRSRYLPELKRELVRRLENLPEPHIRTIYFGGGTPTIYPPAELSDLLGTIREFNVAPGAEISIEANPDTVDREKLQALRESGFNRISLGVQSLDDEELELLGRTHSARQAADAVRAAREVFDSVSVDLICGLPAQKLSDWRPTLQKTLKLQPDHISAYGLMVEPGTPLYSAIEEGHMPSPDEEACADMYDATHEILVTCGFGHYEISSYAREGMECRHNQIYWRNEPYLGCGAGAASYLHGRRMTNLSDPARYIAAIRKGEDAIEFEESLSPAEYASETIMLGLRTARGVDLNQLSEQTGLALHKKYAKQIARLTEEDLAVAEEGCLRLKAPRGFALHSEIAGRFF